VEVTVSPNPHKERQRVQVFTLDSGSTFVLDPDHPDYEQHPLLQGALNSLPVPEDIFLQVRVSSAVPAGISVGTSASVCVALLGALTRLTSPRIDPPRIADLAHQVETVKLNWQSGIQDQICAARGGICFIRMFKYPQSEVEQIEPPEEVYRGLSERLSLIYLGRSHNSSSLHERVIAALEKTSTGPLLRLRQLPEQAHAALLRSDLESFGQVMIENNECQRALHADLIAADADRVIAVARRYGACGWKVNGAGGQGGSLTLLGDADPERREKMQEAIISLGGGIQRLPVTLSRVGLEVTVQNL
jgi:D-glycero-alpha-D-manno-heptose-7-phosphate kinase